MKYVSQLAFDFTFKMKPRHHPSWRVKTIASRHGLPMSQAVFYAREMGLPGTEVR